jgi:hypothetical protein
VSKRSRSRRHRWLAAAATVLAVAGSAQAWAQMGPEYTVEEIAFIAADTDGNNVITEAEMARDTARGFATLDKDGSGTLTPEELGPHDPAQFKRVDSNGDGLLSFGEVMANKVRALQAGDTDNDGGLSFDEMVTNVEQETGGAS